MDSRSGIGHDQFNKVHVSLVRISHAFRRISTHFDAFRCISVEYRLISDDFSPGLVSEPTR